MYKQYVKDNFKPLKYQSKTIDVVNTRNNR